ncbi:MAG TPA: BON domain-containing protein [Myxococcaceae bacterium]|nr:BON domain-containing protein [Myxococcaceae bacterium]
MKTTNFLTLGLLLLGASALAASPDPSSSKSKVDAGTKRTQQRAQDPEVDPSNSAVNEHQDQESTADRQSNAQSDLDLTAKIRRSIVDDKSLSTSAHNVKIIAQNGQVTLKGPVRSEAEKNAVQQQASSIAGQPNVKNELDVQP